MRSVRALEGPWVDTSAKVGPLGARALHQAGILGIVRSLPLPSGTLGQEITSGELAGLGAAGLQVALYQRVRYVGWRPADHSGAADSMHAVAAARSAGYPVGAVIYLDLEGIDGTADETARFANDWCDATRQANYQAGIYCGFQDPLGPADLYTLHRATTYWIDFGPRDVAVRGHALKQAYPEVAIGGIKFDLDQMGPDLLGDVPCVAAI
jgi:hypothetical protein